MADNTGKTAEAVESSIDLTAYPVMVEEIGAGGPGVAISPRSAGSAPADPSATVDLALRDILGWKPRSDDPRGFVGALTQSFDLKDNEGHVEATWKQRSYAVASDLAGGLTGAQASLYSRAAWAVQQAKPLLAGLYPLAVDSDPEDVAALRANIGLQLDRLVEALGTPGGPVFAAVELRFESLLGSDAAVEIDVDVEAGKSTPAVAVAQVHRGSPDPDRVGGLLGALRDVLGLSTTVDLVNTIDEEQDMTNFRILADYVIGLRQSWHDNKRFFTRKPGGATPFFGTQLVLLSRQLSVVAETVGELRGVLETVFIGPLEQQTLEIEPRTWLKDGVELDIVLHEQALDQLVGTRPANQQPAGKPVVIKGYTEVRAEPIFLGELLAWIEDFAMREGPQIIQDGGKFGVGQLFVPTTRRLHHLVAGSRRPLNRSLPAGYFTPRVRRSMQELQAQLLELWKLARPIHHEVIHATGSIRPRSK
jgi:hypothetical protein